MATPFGLRMTVNRGSEELKGRPPHELGHDHIIRCAAKCG